MEIVVILLFVVCAIALDFLPYRKNESKTGNIVYLSILLLGMSVLVLHVIGVKVPSPTDPIKKIVEAVFGPQS